MKDLFRLDREVAVVTGALGKLGPIWIGALLDAGASVFALDLPGLPVCQEFEKLQQQYDKSRLTLDRTDVRDRHSLEAAYRNCRAAFGVPTVLVNNAGIDRPPSDSAKEYRLEEIPFEINRDIFEVNTLGLFLVTQVFGSRMAAAGRMRRLFTDEQIMMAVTNPPERTRAYFRGQCVARFGESLVAANWDSLVFDIGEESLRRVPMMEPLRGGKDRVGALLDRVENPADLLQALGGDSD